MMMDVDSLQSLSHCNNALSDRMHRASLNSAAHLYCFSSHGMTLATHMSLSLARYSTTPDYSSFTGQTLLNLPSDFFNHKLPSSLCFTSWQLPPRALSHAPGQSRPHSTVSSSVTSLSSSDQLPRLHLKPRLLYEVVVRRLQAIVLFV